MNGPIGASATACTTWELLLHFDTSSLSLCSFRLEAVNGPRIIGLGLVPQFLWSFRSHIHWEILVVDSRWLQIRSSTYVATKLHSTCCAKQNKETSNAHRLCSFKFL